MLSFVLGAILKFGCLQVEVEIADTPPLQSKGLMGRETLPKNHGMLFVYKKPQELCFWMKNTKIPLSVGFFNSAKELTQVEEMAPPENEGSSLPIFKSKVPCKYALEMPTGWYKENNISLGDKFTWKDSH